MSSPLNLTWGSSVYATISATNIVNSSGVSPQGNGAIILTNPDNPLLLQNVPAVTDTTKVGLSWVTGVNNGGM